MTQGSPPPHFHVLGNLLCLDLVNTEAMDRGTAVDLLAGFSDLVEWLRAAGNLGKEEARRVVARWDGGAEGRAAWREALALRAALRATAGRLVAGGGAGSEILTLINRILAAQPSYPQLVRSGGRVVSREEIVGESAMQLLVPVARSAAWLLEQGDPALLRKCENPDCVLYFYDTTRNKRRRWCSMDACGGRAKAAAYYRRGRAARR